MLSDTARDILQVLDESKDVAVQISAALAKGDCKEAMQVLDGSPLSHLNDPDLIGWAWESPDMDVLLHANWSYGDACLYLGALSLLHGLEDLIDSS